MKRAKEVARKKDVRIGGGVATIRQYAAAGLIDEMQLSTLPILLGEGENLFSGMNFVQLGLVPVKRVPGENATHVVIQKN
jgi:dihydrofolate reductase